MHPPGVYPRGLPPWCRKCEGLEAQARENDGKMQELQDALTQATARATAADERVTQRQAELQEEQARALDALKAAASSDLEVCCLPCLCALASCIRRTFRCGCL